MKKRVKSCRKAYKKARNRKSDHREFMRFIKWMIFTGVLGTEE